MSEANCLYPYILLLGADDTEMQRIVETLRRLGILYFFAICNGERVHPGNAYNASFPQLYKTLSVTHNRKIFFIECDVPGITPDGRIDHHRPGDPGFAKGPEEYYEASSLGQLFALLGLNPLQDDRVIAAMDHCFSDAMNNRCPGVSREEVRNKKIGSIYTRVKQLIPSYADKIGAAPTVTIGTQQVVFLSEDLGIGYSFPYLIAQLVGVESDMPVILRSRNKDGDPWKLHLCGGNLSRETVVAFMEGWGPAHELQNIYGSPARGYAGGYVFGIFDSSKFLP